jgi:hypothetical protein
MLPANRRYLTPLSAVGVAIIAGIGATWMLSSPDAPASSNTSPGVVTAAEASVNETAAAAQASGCEKQAWPYIDKRCADAAATGPDQGTRQVRVVSTDRGTSSTIVTPVASLPPKPLPQPQPAQTAANASVQQPQVAQPTPAPAAPQTVAAVAQPAFVANAVAVQDAPTTAALGETVSAPPAATPAQKAATPPKLKAAAKAADKRAKASKFRDGNPQAVPADVIEAIDTAETVRTMRTETYGDRGRRVVVSEKYVSGDEETVSVTSPRRPQRVFLVPREDW